MLKKLATNTLAQIIGKIGTALIAIVLISFLTKYLTIEQYGVYNKVYNYLGIFAFLADLGLYTIAIREVSQGKQKADFVLGNMLSLRCVLAGIFLSIAGIIAYFLPGYNDTSTLIGIAIVIVFTAISLINSSLLALMQAHMKMEFSLFSLLAGKIMTLGMIIAGFLLFFVEKASNAAALYMVFGAGLVGIMITTFLNYIHLRKIVRVQFLWDREYIKHIFKISLPYAIALFLSVLYFKVDVILLSVLESPEKADISIGLYGLPMKIIEVLMVFVGFYLNSLLPFLSKKWKENNFFALSHVFGISLKFLFLGAVYIYSCSFFLASDIISLIATPEYISPILHQYNSVQAFKISAGILLFYFPAACAIYMLIASERQAILLWINIGVTFLNIIGNIIFIPQYSFIGSAYVTLGSQFFLCFFTLFYVIRYIKIPGIYFLEIGKTLGGMLGLFLIVFYFPQEYFRFAPFLNLLFGVVGITFFWILYEFLCSYGFYKQLFHKKFIESLKSEK